MIKEIGSDFWEVPISNIVNNLLPEETCWYLSGRSALQAIIKELSNAKSIAMPSWCCDSMIKPFWDAGIKVNFYPVYWIDGLKQEISLDADILFLMDYFGYTTSGLNIQGYKGIVIQDLTHSIFSGTYTDTNYYFGSLRKWCGFWTGGFAWAKDKHALPVEQSDDTGYIKLREKAMQMKKIYVNGGDETDKSYLNIFEQAEEALEHVGIVPANERDVDAAKRLDVDFIRNSRRTNSKILMEAFHNELIFPQLSETDIPMFVPILVPQGKRNELRCFLINEGIYCPVHWPVSEYHSLSEQERFIYENELSLVCDQRYTEDDMYRIVDTINEFWKEV